MNCCKLFTFALAILCALPKATHSQTETRTPNPPAPLGKLVDVGGYRVHVYCAGAGSPTVVIVGAGFSFNWGLVQPEVAKFTQVCAYDHSGIGWSETGPADSCDLRVNEVHVALKNLGVKGPYVFVGHSLGGLVARVYAGKYPEETAGIVFVDHAFTLGMVSRAGVGPDAGGKSVPKAEVPPPPAIPPPPGSTGRSAGLLRPGGGGIEDDPNFSTLSARDRELHLWFMTHMSNQNVFRTNANINPGCSAEAQEMAKKQPHPLAEKPLIDVSTDEMRTPPYVELQKELLALSTNSKEMIAEKSSHFVIIDRPDVVTDAISRVVRSVRTNSEL